MAETTPVPALCQSGCVTSKRYNLVVVALLVANLVIGLTTLVTGVVRDPESPAEPHPAPSSTAPATPSPSLSPTQEPTTGPQPTPSAPNPDPTTGTPCNVFDPECSGTSDGGTTSGITGGTDV